MTREKAKMMLKVLLTQHSIHLASFLQQGACLDVKNNLMLLTCYFNPPLCEWCFLVLLFRFLIRERERERESSVCINQSSRTYYYSPVEQSLSVQSYYSHVYESVIYNCV